MNPQPMNLDSLLLLSEVEGFVAEQSVDRFIDEEVNMAKAMQNRLEETLHKHFWNYKMCSLHFIYVI